MYRKFKEKCPIMDFKSRTFVMIRCYKRRNFSNWFAIDELFIPLVLFWSINWCDNFHIETHSSSFQRCWNSFTFFLSKKSTTDLMWIWTLASFDNNTNDDFCYFRNIFFFAFEETAPLSKADDLSWKLNKLCDGLFNGNGSRAIKSGIEKRLRRYAMLFCSEGAGASVLALRAWPWTATAVRCSVGVGCCEISGE